MTKPRRAAPVVVHAWAVKWRSVKGLDGSYVRLQDLGRRGTFSTRKACKAYIDEQYGYIRERKDLRVYPHGWRVPTPVKVTVTYREIP